MRKSNALAADANAFQSNLEMLLTATRGRSQSHATQGPNLATVRGAIEAVGRQFLNAWVNIDDLTPAITPNDGHFVPESVVTLGSRMFTADQAIGGGH